MVKISKRNEIYTLAFTKRLRVIAKQKTKVYKCRCKLQDCNGKFVRKHKWQKYCSREMLRRGLIQNLNELT